MAIEAFNIETRKLFRNFWTVFTCGGCGEPFALECGTRWSDARDPMACPRCGEKFQATRRVRG